MKTIVLNDLTSAALLAIHNAIADKPAGKSTFSTRAKAIARIEAIAEEKKIPVARRFNADGTARAKEVRGAKPAVKGPVIRAVAEELLLKVVGQDEDGRKLGMKYDAVLAAIKKIFPNANTTVACLRWYCVHMRERGVRVPNRPRVLPPKGDA